MDLFTMMAVGGAAAGGLGNIGSSIGGMFGGKSKADAARKAAEEEWLYLAR